MGLFKFMLKKGPGSPGAATRLLTKKYYEYIFQGDNTPDTAIALLQFRNIGYKQNGIEIPFDKLLNLSNNLYDNVPLIIFSLCCYENSFKPEQLKLYINQRKLIFEVIVGEFNKNCPVNEKYEIPSNIETDLLMALNLIMN